MKSSGEHRRGRSMGSAPPPVIRSAGEKDEDLALFHEMKRREKHNFLHPSPDDLDATLCTFLLSPSLPVSGISAGRSVECVCVILRQWGWIGWQC